MQLKNAASAASYAIQIARFRGLAEIGADELLLGALLVLSRFGIVRFGPWSFDLEKFWIDWMRGDWLTGGKTDGGKTDGPKVAYSEQAVTIFDSAARIALLDRSAEIGLEHILVAFAEEESGLMGELKRNFKINSAAWRAAAAELPRDSGAIAEAEAVRAPRAAAPSRDYLTPEEAAEALGIHVQTLRAYVRSGKLPALRLAGERSLRIRREDLDKVLEPLFPKKQ